MIPVNMPPCPRHRVTFDQTRIRALLFCVSFMIPEKSCTAAENVTVRRAFSVENMYNKLLSVDVNSIDATPSAYVNDIVSLCSRENKDLRDEYDGCDTLLRMTCSTPQACVNSISPFTTLNFRRWRFTDAIPLAADPSLSVSQNLEQIILSQPVDNSTQTIQVGVDFFKDSILADMITFQNAPFLYISLSTQQTLIFEPAHIDECAARSHKHTATSLAYITSKAPFPADMELADFCGRHIKLAVRRELLKFYDILSNIPPTPAACTASNTTIQNAQCTANASVAALDNLPLLLQHPRSVFCERGIQAHVKCLPPCSCVHGTTEYLALRTWYISLGDSLWSSGDSCFKNSTLYESVCGLSHEVLSRVVAKLHTSTARWILPVVVIVMVIGVMVLWCYVCRLGNGNSWKSNDMLYTRPAIHLYQRPGSVSSITTHRSHPLYMPTHSQSHVEDYHEDSQRDYPREYREEMNPRDQRHNQTNHSEPYQYNERRPDMHQQKTLPHIYTPHHSADQYNIPRHSEDQYGPPRGEDHYSTTQREMKQSGKSQQYMNPLGSYLSENYPMAY